MGGITRSSREVVLKGCEKAFCRARLAIRARDCGSQLRRYNPFGRVLCRRGKVLQCSFGAVYCHVSRLRIVKVGSCSQEGIVYKGQTRFVLVALPIGPLVLLSDQVVEMTIVQDIAASFLSSREELDGRGRHVEMRYV